MGGKQSRVVRSSIFDRIRQIGRKNRVVKIGRRKAAKPWARPSPQRPSSLTTTASKPRRNWDDLVLEDLEDLPTDTLFDLEEVQPAPIDRSPPSITATPRRRRDWDDLVIEDLEDVPSEPLDAIQPRVVVPPRRLPPIRARAADYTTDSQVKVAQWMVASIPGIVEPDFFSETARDGRVCSNTTILDATNDGSFPPFPQEKAAASINLPIPRVWTTELDSVSVSSGGERREEREEFDSDSLTEVTSLDSMSVDSELLSILMGGGGDGAFSPQPSVSDETDLDLNQLDLDLNQLVLMFETKEEEEMEKLPDYVLFMSLPPTADLL